MYELQAKALKAATRYCENAGYKILDASWKSPEGSVIDIVADDKGTICFVDVTVLDHYEDGFPTGHAERGVWEIVAASWLSENLPDGSFPVRFDCCDMVVIAPDRALLRYCTNVLSEG